MLDSQSRVIYKDPSASTILSTMTGGFGSPRFFMNEGSRFFPASHTAMRSPYLHIELVGEQVRVVGGLIFTLSGGNMDRAALEGVAVQHHDGDVVLWERFGPHVGKGCFTWVHVELGGEEDVVQGGVFTLEEYLADVRILRLQISRQIIVVEIFGEQGVDFFFRHSAGSIH